MYCTRRNCMKVRFDIFFIGNSAKETQTKNYKGKTDRYTINGVS